MTFKALYGCHCTPATAPKLPLPRQPYMPVRVIADCVYTMTETGREDPKCDGCNRKSNPKESHAD